MVIDSSCSSTIYQSFDEPILVENIFEVNDSILKKDPVSLLIRPSPVNEFLGYPLGLAINQLVGDNPDEKFELWLNKKDKRKNRLEKLISSKQVDQLKRYNKSFNNFLKGLGKDPVYLSDIDFIDNKRRLKQFYDNIGYFDSQVSHDTVINLNQAKVKYSIYKNERYLIDTLTFNIESKYLDSKQGKF